MIKLNSISGVSYQVADLEATAVFYELLGFRFGKRDADYLVCYVNWFWVEFHQSANTQPAGDQSLYVSVPDVDEFHASLTEKGLHPTQAIDQPWGRRECSVTDPDGNVITFFKKQ